MPITFSKEEIRQFLKEQGYDVSDEKTLKKFIHDFKKLIKFEEMKRRRRRLGHFPEDTVLDSTDGRYANTTTTSTQDTTSYSYEDDDLLNNDVADSRRGNRHPDEKSPRRVPPSSSSKSSPRKPVTPAKKYPPNPQHKGKQGRSRETQSYGSDNGTSSFEDYEHARANNNRDHVPPKYNDKHRRSPSTGRPNTSAKTAPVASAAPKKQGNRLVMKRITASQGANGDSVIEESDIDLGPKRPVNKFVRRPAAGQSRPQTAPVSRGGKSGVVSNQSGRPPVRPTSAKPQQQGEGEEEGEDPCDFVEADELFHALNELIFPSDQINSQDSLFTDSDRQKTLLKPPPHVARDPVLLYHWYKTYNWDVYTIPGEDRHMKLRWNVRAKTVGGYHPCVEARNFYKPKSHCC